MSFGLYTLNAPVSCTAGTSVTMGAGGEFACTVTLEADGANSGYVYVGASNVTTTNGHRLAPGQAMNFTFDQVYGVNNRLLLDDFYFSTDASGNKVRISYMRYEGHI